MDVENRSKTGLVNPVYIITTQKVSKILLERQSYGVSVSSVGIVIAPHHFTKIMKVPISLLRRLGIRLIIYLDDILILNQSKLEIMSDISIVVNLLEGFSFLINNQNSVLQATQSIEFMGYTLNSVIMTLSLPKEKVLKIVNSCM